MMAVAKVMISMPEDFLKEIDRIVRQEHRNRSEFFREAARLYLQVKHVQAVPGQDPLVQGAVAIQDAIARQNHLDDWDGAAEIRKWRAKPLFKASST